MFLVNQRVPLTKDALISDSGCHVTYGDLQEDSLRFSRSVDKRCFMIIVADNAVDTFRFYIAAMSGNCVPLLLEPNIFPDYLRNYITRYRPRYIWAPVSWETVLEEAGSVVHRGEAHILVRTEMDPYPMHPDLALLLTTSGSTGNPKVVRLSHRNLEENAHAIVEELQMNADDRGVTTLPMNYTYGMAILHMHLYAGATLLVTSRRVIDPKFREFIYAEKLTNFQGVPYIHEMMDRMNFYQDPPENLRFVTMGGGKAPEAFQSKLNRLFAQKGIRFFALYGQTEGTTMLTKLPEGCVMNPPDCIGVACYGMHAETHPETGELIFRGSSVCLGFAYGWEDLNRGDDNQGILYTGDLARIDQQGRIYLLGRLKRIVKMAGKRINMDDVETLVQQSFPGTRCACSGTDDHLHIFITGSTPAREIKLLVSTRLHVSHLSMEIFRISEIPRTDRGKIDYQKMERERGLPH